MAAAQKGTAHWFGVTGNIANATVVGINRSEGFETSEETKDQQGVVIETRKDSRLKEVSVTIRPQTGYGLPNIGEVITLTGSVDGVFELDSIGEAYQNDQHTEVTLELVQHEGITY